MAQRGFVHPLARSGMVARSPVSVTYIIVRSNYRIQHPLWSISEISFFPDEDIQNAQAIFDHYEKCFQFVSPFKECHCPHPSQSMTTRFSLAHQQHWQCFDGYTKGFHDRCSMKSFLPMCAPPSFSTVKVCSQRRKSLPIYTPLLLFSSYIYQGDDIGTESSSTILTIP